MAKEQAKKSKLDIMRERLEKAEAGSGNSFLFFTKKGEYKKVRFLTEFEDAFMFKVHAIKGEVDGKKVNIVQHPCLNHYGKECPTCKMDYVKDYDFYSLSLYEYEFDAVKPTFARFDKFFFLLDLAEKHDRNGNITDRDYEIKQIGQGLDVSFNIESGDKEKFGKPDLKPLTEEKILEIIKNDRFRFLLPEGVVFEDLKDYDELDDL